MDLTPLQTELLKCLRSAVGKNSQRRVVYRSEYLGYLPFGLYHWMIADGQDISLTFPPDWSRSDLEILEKVGVLEKVDEWRNPNDEFEIKITYKVF